MIRFLKIHWSFWLALAACLLFWIWLYLLSYLVRYYAGSMVSKLESISLLGLDIPITASILVWLSLLAIIIRFCVLALPNVIGPIVCIRLLKRIIQSFSNVLMSKENDTLKRVLVSDFSTVRENLFSSISQIQGAYTDLLIFFILFFLLSPLLASASCMTLVLFFAVNQKILRQVTISDTKRAHTLSYTLKAILQRIRMHQDASRFACGTFLNERTFEKIDLWIMAVQELVLSQQWLLIHQECIGRFILLMSILYNMMVPTASIIWQGSLIAGALMLQAMLSQLSFAQTQLALDNASAKRIFQEIDNLASLPGIQSSQDLPKKYDYLTLENVYVRYEGERPLSFQCNVSLMRGITWITGASGLGKTSMLKVIMGHTPYQGNIRVGTSSLESFSFLERLQFIDYVPSTSPRPAGLKVYDVLNNNMLIELKRYGIHLSLEFPLRDLPEYQTNFIYCLRAVESTKKIVLLDEPIRHLRKDYLEAFTVILQRHTNKIVVIVSHVPIPDKIVNVISINAQDIIQHGR